MLCGILFPAYAKMNRKPTFRPDWTYEAPAPPEKNKTYLYVVEHGEGQTQREALNQAIGRVFQSTANRIGQFVSVDEINRAVQAGTDYTVISQKMKIPVHKVCEFPMHNSNDGTWTMYILCQVALSGNIKPEFEPCNECTKHERFDELMEIWEKQQQDSIDAVENNTRKSNTRAIVASTFIPGMGQMLKKQGGTGAAFLVSEVALFGAGTACHFIGQNKIKNATNIDEHNLAVKEKKGTWDVAMWTCFGVGAAVHITNMVHAWCVKDKNPPVNVTFAPAIIPTNEYSTPSYAMGAGMQIKF